VTEPETPSPADLPWNQATPTISSPPPLPDEIRPAAQRRTGLLVLAGLLALVVLAGAAIVAVWLGGRPAPTRPAAAASAAEPGVADVVEAPSAGPSAASTSASASASASPRASASPSGPPGLVASDDFTGTAPDPARWGIYDSTDSKWSHDMVRVTNGELVIAGVGRDPSGAGNRSGGLCWCGTGGDQRYGRWQVRARFDAGAGYGPIIGLWPQSDHNVQGWITFADSPLPDRHKLHGYLAWTAGTRQFDRRELSGDFTAWHTYTVEWRETFVRMYVDTTLYYDSTTGQGVVIPSGPMHLILQQTVGPKDGVPAPDAATPDMVGMHIDWVRIYR
jgi:beta-glucanase (GH16 family)